VRGALLVPFITLLIFLGSMSATGQVGDLVVTLFFGALAWTMHKFGWPVVPLILGLVLGDRAENSLWISTRIFGFSWLGRPIVIGLIILAAAVVIFTLTRMRKGVEMDAEEESPGLPLARLIFSLCAFGLAIGAVVMALEWPVAARLFPVAIGSVTAVVAFFQVVADLMHFLKKRGVPVRQEGPEERALSRVMNRRTAEIFGWMVGLFAAIWAVGFTFLVAPFLLLYLKLSAQERWKTVLIAAGVTGLIYWAFFDQFLNVPTPSGAIIRW
jgi:putative tricarboxylic transport membrane protein